MSQKFRNLVAFDFTSTCFKTTPMCSNEIIECAAMIIDTSRKCVLDNDFHFYIKPRIDPILSRQCIEETGIKQETINESHDIAYVMNKWNEFCYSNNLLSNNSCIVLCGNWCLKVMWPIQSEIINNHQLNETYYAILNWYRTDIPSDIMNMINLYYIDPFISKPALFHSWINIKDIYHEIYNKRVTGMKDILYQFCIPYHGGKHSAIDHVINLSQIVLFMLIKDIQFHSTFTNCNDMTINDDFIIAQNIEMNKFTTKHVLDEEVIINKQSDCNVIEIGIETQISGKKQRKRRIMSIVRGINEEILREYGINNMTPKKITKALKKEFSTGVGYRKLSKSHDEKVLIIQGDIRCNIAKFFHLKWNIPKQLLYYKDQHSLKPCF